MLCNRTQIRAVSGTPQQHRGQQGVEGGFVRLHLPDKTETETALFKPGIPAGPEGNAGEECKCFDHSKLLAEDLLPLPVGEVASASGPERVLDFQ